MAPFSFSYVARNAASRVLSICGSFAFRPARKPSSIPVYSAMAFSPSGVSFGAAFAAVFAKPAVVMKAADRTASV